MKTKLKISVVDDERIVRVTIADDLRDAGYNVREFADAGAALASLDDFKPDIIITDLKMPGIDGIGLMKKIREIMRIQKRDSTGYYFDKYPSVRR